MSEKYFIKSVVIDDVMRHEENNYICKYFGSDCPFNGKQLIKKVQIGIDPPI